MEGETNLDVISDKTFLEKVTPNTRRIYQEIINSVVMVTGPVIKMVPIRKKEMRLVIGFKQGTTMGLFSALSDLYHYYGCTSLRKYVGMNSLNNEYGKNLEIYLLTILEHFSNGVTIICIYLASTPDPECKFNFPPIEVCIEQIVREVSLLNCIPQNLFQAHFMSGKLSLQETIYAHCVCHFVGHFLNRFGRQPLLQGGQSLILTFEQVASLGLCQPSSTPLILPMLS
jgi:glutamate dehydrogenase